MNSIAWLVWHLTRVQDAAVSRFVGDRPQVLDEGRWNQAMRLDRRDVGSGMTGEEVDALSAAVDMTALRGYHRAVAERTKLIATSLSRRGLDRGRFARAGPRGGGGGRAPDRRGPLGRGVLGAGALERLVSAAGGTASPLRALLRRRWSPAGSSAWRRTESASGSHRALRCPCGPARATMRRASTCARRCTS